MHPNDTPDGRYHYYTRAIDDLGMDRRFIAVDLAKHDDLMHELGWERLVYRRLSSYLTSTEINRLKYGDAGIEYRKGVHNGVYGMAPSGRTINELADEWGDMMDALDDADKVRRNA